MPLLNFNGQHDMKKRVQLHNNQLSIFQWLMLQASWSQYIHISTMLSVNRLWTWYRCTVIWVWMCTREKPFIGLFYSILKWDNRKGKGPQAEQSYRTGRAHKQCSGMQRASPLILLKNGCWNTVYRKIEIWCIEINIHRKLNWNLASCRLFIIIEKSTVQCTLSDERKINL
jgi:hypothetical protein